MRDCTDKHHRVKVRVRVKVWIGIEANGKLSTFIKTKTLSSIQHSP